MEQVADLLVEDNIVIIEGRLELSDDSESKLSLDSIELAPKTENLTAPLPSAPPPPEYRPINRDIPLAVSYEPVEETHVSATVQTQSKPQSSTQKKSSTRGTPSSFWCWLSCFCWHITWGCPCWKNI
jgi:hypothetical protein